METEGWRTLCGQEDVDYLGQDLKYDDDTISIIDEWRVPLGAHCYAKESVLSALTSGKIFYRWGSPFGAFGLLFTILLRDP